MRKAHDDVIPANQQIVLSDNIVLDESTAEHELSRLNQNLSVLAHQLYFSPKEIYMEAVFHVDTLADVHKFIDWLYAKAFENKEDNMNE